MTQRKHVFKEVADGDLHSDVECKRCNVTFCIFCYPNYQSSECNSTEIELEGLEHNEQ